jgi:hypothetical protein
VAVFGTRKRSRTKEVRQAAEQAWDQLVSALESAGDAARTAGRRTQDYADGAQSRAGAAAEEARKRTGKALDALAGRRSPLQWEWIVGAAVGGLVLGWLAAAGAKRAIATSTEAIDETTVRVSAKPLDPSVSPQY